MYLFIGGPAFKISIKEGHHAGIIYNLLNPDLVKGSNPEWLKTTIFSCGSTE